MAKKRALTTEATAEKFVMLTELLESIYNEMKEFSKKKPDEPLNDFKVKNVNRVLVQVKDILKDEPTAVFLDVLDDETLPTNSDAILVIGQFQASMERFKAKYCLYLKNSHKRQWNTKENPIDE